MLFAAFHSPTQYLKEHKRRLGGCLFLCFSVVRVSGLFPLCSVLSKPNGAHIASDQSSHSTAEECPSRRSE